MTMTDTPGAELAIRAQPVLPMAPEQARQVMQAYEDMCRAVLGPDDVQDSGDGRQFTKRSGFQKLSAAYGISTEILSTTTETVTRDTDDGTESILIARAVARAVHPSGRHADGDGACSSNEKRFRKGDQRLEHNLSSTAVTRAVNRAISNLIAFGTVSAEEADEATLSPATPVLPAWAAPVSDIPGVAQNLVRVLRAGGVEDTAGQVAAIGNQVFDQCDKTFPVALARLAELLADAVEPADTPPAVDGTTTEDIPTEQEEAA